MYLDALLGKGRRHIQNKAMRQIAEPLLRKLIKIGGRFPQEKAALKRAVDADGRQV